MGNGLSLAGAGFADDGVPRESVEVFATGLEGFDAFLEFPAQIVELGEVGGTHAARSRRRALLKITPKPLVLLFALQMVPKQIAADDEQQQDQEQQAEDEEQLPAAARAEPSSGEEGAE